MKSPKEDGNGKDKKDEEEKKEGKQPFKFDEEGMPIWEDKDIPRELIPPRPSGWDQAHWEDHMSKTFRKMRQKNFKHLHASCGRKLKRKKAEEEKQRKLDEERKRKEQEQREKEEAVLKEQKRLRAKEMEKEAQARLLLMAFKDFEGWDFSEEEDENLEDKKGLGDAGNQEEIVDTSVLDNGEANGDQQKVEKGNKRKRDGGNDDGDDSDDEGSKSSKISRQGNGFVPILKLKKIDGDLEMVSRQPLGGSAFDSESHNSDDSNVTPRRRSGRNSTRTPRSKTKSRDLSEENVIILSDPLVLRALESFQSAGECGGLELDILKDEKVLDALKNFQSNVGKDNCYMTSTPTEDEIPERLIPPELIKTENKQPEKEKDSSRERGAKRRLLDLSSFTDAVKNTPKAKKARKQHPLNFSAGSPIRDVVPSRDATTEDLVKFAEGKVETMKTLDSMLKKTPVSSPKITRNLFETVSFYFLSSFQFVFFSIRGNLIHFNYNEMHSYLVSMRS